MSSSERCGAYDAYRTAEPGTYAEQDYIHEESCCFDHHEHHTATRNTEWPIGGCWTCEQEVLATCRTLASNLAVAGALCAAFELGCLFGGQWMARDPVYPTFEPGCRSRAPSGEALAALQQKVMDALTACGWPSPVNRPAPGYINKESSVKVYKYEQYFGRMGSLSSVFAARDEDIKRLKKRGRIYLGEVLGKHSEVTATISDETLRELTADPAVVSFFTEHLGGCSGTDLIGHMDNEESEDDDEEDDDE